MKPAAPTLFVLILSVFSAGCSDWVYEGTNKGELKGKIIVEWLENDLFRYLPDKDNPLIFTRSNRDVIQPREMITDGGSIPRTLRAIKSYSPWGYAPAFIIHDWLFEMRHCQLPGYKKYDLDEAASVLSEVLKTMMENPKFGDKNKLVLYSMYEAVRSRAAKDYWDNGPCTTQKLRQEFEQKSFVQPRARFVIEF